jgi:hypothetical protein
MNEHEIESLALHYSFDELTADQQALVLSHLFSGEAYERLRTLLLATRSELLAESRTIEPHAGIRSDIHAAMQARQRIAAAPGFSLHDLFTYRVPAYTAAAGFALALVLAVLLGRSTVRQQPVVQERIVYVPAVDTQSVDMEKEEIVQRVTDSLKEELRKQFAVQPARLPVRARRPNRMNIATQPASTVPVLRAAAPATSGNRFVGLANLPQLDVQKRGKNLAEDSAFSRFRRTAVRDSF